MQDKVRIAAVQIDITKGANEENLKKIIKNLRVARDKGADLVVFPECALCGYVFSSREEALPYMETIPGPATEEISRVCHELGAHVVFGLLEEDGHYCLQQN